MPQCCTAGAIRRIDLSCCLTETGDELRSSRSVSSFKRTRSARPSFCSGLSRLRTRSSDVPSASLGGLARAAVGRRHSCAMVGQHRPASPGWRRRRGAAHPASGRLVRPRRMLPTMGSRLRREGGAGQRRCPSRCQQRARRCACPAAEVVAQRPHGCVARRRAGREHPERAGVLVTTVVPLPVGKHCNSGSFAAAMATP